MSVSAISPAQPSGPPHYEDLELKHKDIIETYTTNVEADESNTSERGVGEILAGADRKEIVPTEAFRWNVEGDQSPCMWLHSSLT